MTWLILSNNALNAMENNKEYHVTTNEDEMWNNIDPTFWDEFYDNHIPLWGTAITLLVVIALFIGLMLLFFA